MIFCFASLALDGPCPWDTVCKKLEYDAPIKPWDKHLHAMAHLEDEQLLVSQVAAYFLLITYFVQTQSILCLQFILKCYH